MGGAAIVKLRPSPLVCRQAVELMSDYLDGALSGRDTRRLEKHLAVCESCRTYLEQLRLTISLSGSAGPDDLEPAALAELVDVFRKFRGGPDASSENDHA